MSQVSQVTIESYADIGRYLRDCRESLRLDLFDVARMLNIRPRYLEAIENGQLSYLPGPVYAKGYMLNYADYLGVNKEEVAAQFERLSGAPPKAAFYCPEPTRKENKPGQKIVLLSLVFVGVVYALWDHFSQGSRSPLEIVSALPERFAEMVMPKFSDGRALYGCFQAQGENGYPFCTDDWVRGAWLTSESDVREMLAVEVPFSAIREAAEEAAAASRSSAAEATETPAPEEVDVQAESVDEEMSPAAGQ